MLNEKQLKSLSSLLNSVTEKHQNLLSLQEQAATETTQKNEYLASKKEKNEQFISKSEEDKLKSILINYLISVDDEIYELEQEVQQKTIEETISVVEKDENMAKMISSYITSMEKNTLLFTTLFVNGTSPERKTIIFKHTLGGYYSISYTYVRNSQHPNIQYKPYRNDNTDQLKELFEKHPFEEHVIPLHPLLSQKYDSEYSLYKR